LSDLIGKKYGKSIAKHNVDHPINSWPLTSIIIITTTTDPER
jgi:hypothetical protein